MKDRYQHRLTTQMLARWGDMDAFGHVNNARYFSYCEQARIEFLNNTNCYQPHTGEGPVVVTAELTYLKPLIAPSMITVDLYTGDPGRSSVMTYHEVSAGGVLYCTAVFKVVWVNYAEGKSIPLPDELR